MELWPKEKPGQNPGFVLSAMQGVGRRLVRYSLNLGLGLFFGNALRKHLREIDRVDHQRRKPPLRVTSAMIWRAKGNSRRGHSMKSTGSICSCGKPAMRNTPP